METWGTCGLWTFTSSSAWPEFPPPSWSAGRAHPAMAGRHTAPLRADPDLQTQPEHKHNRPGELQAPLQSSTSPYWEVVELQTGVLILCPQKPYRVDSRSSRYWGARTPSDFKINNKLSPKTDREPLQCGQSWGGGGDLIEFYNKWRGQKNLEVYPVDIDSCLSGFSTLFSFLAFCCALFSSSLCLLTC